MGTSIGIANAIGFGRPRGGVILPQWFKDSLVCWYNPKRQGLTNDYIKSKGGEFLLKDFSKNHLDMSMHNFGGEGMSGMDGYGINFNNFYISHYAECVITQNKIVLKQVHDTTDITQDNFCTNPIKEISESCKLVVSNLQIGQLLFYRYNTEDGTSTYFKLENGENIVPKSYKGTYQTWFRVKNVKANTDLNITIEQLPLYEGSLCFDGVDDYGISENQPILTDYTVICKRKWLTTEGKNERLAEKKNAFVFEMRYNNQMQAYSFGGANYRVDSAFSKDGISVQTKNEYNGFKLNVGDAKDNKILTLGHTNNITGEFWTGALYQFFLFNRTLTQDEIDYVKYVVMKEPLPEPIAVYDAKGRTNEDADRDILPNLAPNGNHDYDITLNNFAFSGDSGYGGYGTDITKYFINDPEHCTRTISSNKITFIPQSKFHKFDILVYNHVKCSKRLIIDLKEDIEITFTYRAKNDQKIFSLRKGINYIEISDLLYQQEFNDTIFRYVGDDWDMNKNFTIELLPKYPNALVFDGIDDYGVCEKMPIFTPEKGFTVIAERKYIGRQDLCVLYSNYNNADSNSATIGFEGFANKLRVSSFNEDNYSLNLKLEKNSISYVTSNKYNNQSIKKGDNSNQNSSYYIGRWNNFSGSKSIKGAFYQLHLFDHDLTPKEIEMYIQKHIDKKYKLPIVEQINNK